MGPRLSLLPSSALLVLAGVFFFYPAALTLRTALSRETRSSAQPPRHAQAFQDSARRYAQWARGYLASLQAADVDSEDVARTEWPIFGSVFFLLSAEEVPSESAGPALREAVTLAAQVVVHPKTAAWVQKKWGDHYRERENVFYRMLFVLGLSSYQKLTGNSAYASLVRTQAESLGSELLARPHHLADDYPGECYPTDVLWAAAALKRVATRGGGGDVHAIDTLSEGLLRTLNGLAQTETGLPAFRVDARTGAPEGVARGSANSGMLCLAAEIDATNARQWFDSYTKNYWEAGSWLQGFREFPRSQLGHSDVDSGPVVFGLGSVATAFGIGAARSVGRFDYAAPLVMEAVAVSWPTPFGPLLPGVLGWAVADGWCFGELALHFALTRPSRVTPLVSYEGAVPGVVWLCLLWYLSGGAVCVWLSARLSPRS